MKSEKKTDLNELDKKCISYCNIFFNMFQKNELNKLNEYKNDCISSCTSGKKYYSGSIGQHVGSICYEIIIKK